jgi:hypothetical protein
VDVDAEIDRLYATPLDEFVSRRDELAKRLRSEGERDAAESVKKLRKPTAGAWALNQAVRRRRRETDDLLAAGERLRAAHEALLSGGDAAALREAMQDERILATTLADCAEAIASETGKSGPALRERVRSTLQAATVDEEAREELAKGRFVREREAAGLGPVGAVAGPATRPKRSRAAAGTGRQAAGRERRAAAPRDRRGGGAEAERDDSAAERRRAERVAEAERFVAEARTALEQAQAGQSSAVAGVESARQALREAEAAEREARRSARDRRQELAKRERELERLRARKS